MILYEYPFNESIRTMLRLEHLFDRLGQLIERDAPVDHHFALATIFEVMDVASRACGSSSLIAAMIAAERALALPPSAVRRLAALSVAVTEDAKRVAARLRLSNAEAKALDSMGHRWWRFADKDQARARRLHWSTCLARWGAAARLRSN